METHSHLTTEALLFLGSRSQRYRNPYEGKNPNGFDCSGFVWFLLNRLGFPIAEDIRHVNEFFDRFGVLIHSRAVEAGDLVFFSWNGHVPQHMGIMVSQDTYIHAPGVDKTTVSLACIKERAILHSQSQIYFSNPIGFKRLAIDIGRYKMIIGS